MNARSKTGHETKKAFSYSRMPMIGKGYKLIYFYLNRARTLTALFYFVTYRIAFANLVDQTGRMYKDFFPATAGRNKSEPFSLIKKFYCSCCHDIDIDVDLNKLQSTLILGGFHINPGYIQK